MFAKKALAASLSAEPVFVESVFSTYLYTGNGSTQTITNGIDLSGKGGLVWMKGRSGATDHALYDTARGATKDLVSNSIAAETTQATGLTAFSGTGFSLGALAKLNTNAATYASWTFRKQAKFFDVVTYTGNGVAGRTVAHNLGSVPGCIIVKRVTVTTSNWAVYHRSLSNTEYVFLNTSDQSGSSPLWNNTTATDSVFTVGSSSTVNANGGVYIAYLFAHNAGGFGLSGTDNVISCGSFTTDGSGDATVTLGYEPQLVIIKTTGSAGNWAIFDTMRGMPASGSDNRLFPNLSAAEDTGFGGIAPTATGFNGLGLSGSGLGSNLTYIYIAIRRGPMKVPTSGTEVYNAQTPAPTGVDNRKYTGAGFPLDAIFLTHRTGGGFGTWIEDRLRGAKKPLYSYSTTFEDGFSQGSTQGPASFDQDGWTGGSGDSGQWDYNVGYTNVFHYFRRAPGFFDVVCYTGDGVSTRSLTHNLGVAPELAIFKSRSYAGSSWVTFQKDVCTSANQLLGLNTNNSVLVTGNYFPSGFSSSITSTTLNNIGNSTAINRSGDTYVAYLFATLAGVSKVGSYTGSGTTKQIDCGFTAGARFVLIKRTDSTGDWYVYDSARGIVAGNDPYLFLNSTAAEVTNTDYVDTYSAGFELSSTAPAGLNANGGTYIFLAIA